MTRLKLKPVAARTSLSGSPDDGLDSSTDSLRQLRSSGQH